MALNIKNPETERLFSSACALFKGEDFSKTDVDQAKY
jgi:hypothetical protein